MPDGDARPASSAGRRAYAQLTSQDVVRHRLVGDIVDAYEKWQAIQDDAKGTNGWKGRH